MDSLERRPRPPWHGAGDDLIEVSVRLPPELERRLRQVAARERRSVTAQIIVCVERCLDSLPAQPDRTLDTPAPYPGTSSSSSGAGGE